MKKYDMYLMFDKPVPYKKLLVYPVELKNFFYLYYYSSCLLIDKDSIPDVNVISMSYFDYICKYTTQENPWALYFIELLQLVLKKERKSFDIKFNRDNKAIFIIDNEEYNSEDFEELRDIICEQNLIEIPDYSIQKEIRDKLKEAEKIKAKNSKHKMGDLEDQIASLAVLTGWKTSEIEEMSIRRFQKLIQRADNLIHYRIYLSASMSGFVDFKDKSFIKHWLLDLDTDKKQDGLVSFDAVKDKIGFADKM